MTERWEYLRIDFSSTLIEGKTPAGRTEYSTKSHIEITRPGQAAETQLVYDSRDPEAETPSAIDLLNEFGGEGWELVAETVLESVVASSDSGWPDVGAPIKTRWTLKRRLAP